MPLPPELGPIAQKVHQSNVPEVMYSNSDTGHAIVVDSALVPQTVKDGIIIRQRRVTVISQLGPNNAVLLETCPEEKQIIFHAATVQMTQSK